MNDDPNRRMAEHEVWSAQLRMLSKHFPAMQASQEELAHSVERMEVPRPTATRVYVWYGLGALADIHATAMSIVAKEQDFSLHTLALNAIRVAVNILYVLADASGDRLTGALRQHLDAEYARLMAWLSVEPENESAAARAQFVEAHRRLQPWYADAPAWPPLGARADATNIGEWVHPIMERAADAEELLAQRLSNFLECERGSEAERKAAHMYRTAKGDSDAQYVETVALRLFATVLQRTATLFGDRVAATVAESAIERLDAIVADHNKLNEAQRNDDSIYIRFPTNP